MDKKKIMWFWGDGFSSEYNAILARGTALGYTLPSAAQRIKQNSLINTLKSLGIWSLLDVFYVYSTDGNADFATLNWKAPTLFQCSQVNSPTFTSNQGFNSNGTTSYLTTQWDPLTNGSNFTQNLAGIICYVHTAGAADASDNVLGSSGATVAHGISLSPKRNTGVANRIIARLNTSTPIETGNTESRGFYHIKRTASNALAIFKDGSSILSSAEASTGLTSQDIFVCAFNSNGTPANFSTKIIGCFGSGASLNGLELSFYNAWNTYFTSL